MGVGAVRQVYNNHSNDTKNSRLLFLGLMMLTLLGRLERERERGGGVRKRETERGGETERERRERERLRERRVMEEEI